MEPPGEPMRIAKPLLPPPGCAEAPPLLHQASLKTGQIHTKQNKMINFTLHHSFHKQKTNLYFAFPTDLTTEKR